MAFFDDIGKKISLAGEGAVSKGRVFADVARLNSAVAEEEKKINNSYYQIGKLYVALHPQDYEADFAALVGSIISSQSKIQTLKQQIQEIKGVTRCEKCGAEVPNNIAFCSACGSPMPKREATLDENHVKCDGCGAIVDKNLRFCTSCGKSLVKPVQAATQAEVPVSPAPLETENSNICPSCGAAIRDNLKFCTACGFSLDDSSKDIYSSSQSKDVPVSNMKKCPSCGALMENELAFCTECGTPLN